MSKTEKSNTNKNKDKAKKLAGNVLANALSKESIDKAVTKWFTETKKSRIKKSVNRKELAFIFVHNDILWLNNYAFSTTKADDKGYCTYPFKVLELKALVQSRKGGKVGDWAPRVPVHCVLWRYYNNYAQITEQISHVCGDLLVAGFRNLIDEDGVLNRSRSACHKYEWMNQVSVGDCKCIRCPHEPICIEPPERPSMDEFLDAKPAGQQYLRPVNINNTK